MTIRIWLVATLGCLLFPALAGAQTVPGDVTLEVPLNLTRLAPDITKIDITCYMTSRAIVGDGSIRGAPPDNKFAGNIVLDVTKGRLITTANVVVAVPSDCLQNPIGQPAEYECMMTGYSTGIRVIKGSGSVPAGWGFFDEKSTNPSFIASPTPAKLTGSFTW